MIKNIEKGPLAPHRRAMDIEEREKSRRVFLFKTLTKLNTTFRNKRTFKIIC